jgi:molybdopterin-guanine dinucleotide biosynthesis protein A
MNYEEGNQAQGHTSDLTSAFIIHNSSFIIPFSAVLLAGGRSSRMGRDKALLTLPGDGRPLWLRQLDDVLRPLRPVELFFSGPARPGLPADVRVLADETPGEFLGPLAGIAAALGAMRADSALLVVVAVDLPAMTADFFRARLLPCCAANRGAVPRGDDGFYEPLAAIYPRECQAFAGEQLRGPDRSLQNFLRRLQTAGLIEAVKIGNLEQALFANWNTPADVAPL